MKAWKCHYDYAAQSLYDDKNGVVGKLSDLRIRTLQSARLSHTRIKLRLLVDIIDTGGVAAAILFQFIRENFRENKPGRGIAISSCSRTRISA